MSEANTFHLSVASVGETHFDGHAISVTLPGESGELTILAHHAPIVTTLKAGTIAISGETEISKDIHIDGGVLEVANNRAVVLL